MGTTLPRVRRRTRRLSPEQRQENRVLAHTRRGIEHVIRRMKVFRVLGVSIAIGGIGLPSGFNSSRRSAT
ncbi:transposase family protein [Deinococcus sp. Arct2-2]|uniref:transposase family protein n=1 Tax=Deinococcus sp. Arct2-2 TaxID=2568653 RepID=UPI001F0D98B4|nr:transposase family protein [Deinococcus sp. Arct2-2]